VEGLWRDSDDGLTQIIMNGLGLPSATAAIGTYSNGTFVPSSPGRANYTCTYVSPGVWTFVFPDLLPTNYTATVTETTITFAPPNFTFTRII
jgi:hypothetical protein